MDKSYILEEIRRIAVANGGVPPGQRRFATESGIRISDWRGRHWARWPDALREAGLAPNEPSAPVPEHVVIGKLVDFVRELGRFPTQPEMRLRRRMDRTFPSLDRETKHTLVARVRAYCVANPGHEDVQELLPPVVAPATSNGGESGLPEAVDGFVYLIRSGRFYKLGRTNALGRREYELAIQLPEKAVTVHSIKTDDPAGIEAYWHKRFESKRRNGEWFELTKEDVRAFKRRRIM